MRIQQAFAMFSGCFRKYEHSTNIYAMIDYTYVAFLKFMF